MNHTEASHKINLLHSYIIFGGGGGVESGGGECNFCEHASNLI